MQTQPAAGAAAGVFTRLKAGAQTHLALISAALIAALFAACTGPFTAEIVTGTASGQAPLNVSFTNDGSEAESHTWDFGDGSEPQNTGAIGATSHTFTRAGTFTVTLNTAKGEDAATSTITVTVSPGPLAAIDMEEWQDDVTAGNSVRVGARAVDEFGNVIEAASLSFQAPAAAGSVDANGNFQASVASGEFPGGLSVTATLGDSTVSATADLNVVPSTFDRVVVEPAELEVTPTEAVQLDIRPLDIYGNVITDAQIAVTAQGAVGTVTQQGRFTAARTVGQADEGITVSVTVDGVEQEVTVPVEIVPGPLASVQITPGAVETAVTGSQALSAVTLDQFGNQIDGLSISWSATPDAGEVSATGQFTAGTGAGDFASAVTASATQGGSTVRGSIDVTVLPGEFSQVVAAAAQAVAGETAQLTASAADEYGNLIEGATLAWSVTNSAVGSITGAGVLTPATRARVYSQSVSVSATLDGATFETSVDVEVLPSTLSQVVIAPGDVTLGMSIEQQYVAVGGDRFGNRISGVTFTWSASEAAGTIDASGVFTSGSTPGTYANAVTVVARHGGREATRSGRVVIDPDRIIFYSENDEEFGQFIIMNADGSGPEGLDIGVFSVGPASYSPDGRLIVFDLYVFGGGILISDESGEFISLVLENAVDYGYQTPAWSPDGRRVVMVRQRQQSTERDLVLIDIDGGSLTVLTQTAAGEYRPKWSPDGAFIIFDETPVGGTGDIYRINVQTGQRQRLTNHSADDSFPSYSPDGTRVLFASARDGNYEIYVMDADGANPVNLTSSSSSDIYPSWSEDGTKILFASNRDGDFEIYSMNADGSGVTKLTNNSGLDLDPVWAPRKTGVPVNANAIILPSESEGQARTVQALTAQARVSVVRIVTNLGSGSGFVIHSDGLILTNNHVIAGANSITVTLDDGTQHTGTVVGRDLTHDMAVIRINATGLTPLQFGALTSNDLGSEVLALGYPLGSSNLNVTRGVISSLKVDAGRNINWVQTDAAINFGNSGGPMINFQGEVIGIVSAALFGESVENVGFAIGSSTVLVYLDRLIAGETVFIN